MATTWDRYIELHLLLTSRGLSTLVQSSRTIAALRSLDYVQSDAVPVRLYCYLPSGDAADPLTPARLANGSVIVYTAKPTSALSTGALLFYCDEWTEVPTVTGEGEDAVTTYHYEAVLNLLTTEAEAAFEALTASRRTLDIIGELEIQNASNTQRTSYQHAGTIARQVYAGEAEPTPATPVYPAPSALALKGEAVAERVASAAEVTANGLYYIGGGSLVLWDPAANGGAGARLTLAGTYDF